MEDNEDAILFRAQALLAYYEKNKHLINPQIQVGLNESVERLSRDLARVLNGSRPELVLSVKMGTRSIKRSLEVLIPEGELDG